MNISKLALITLLGGALMAFGCSSDSDGGEAGSGGAAGTGGTAGAGGTGGATGGTGGSEPVACEATENTCMNGDIDPIEDTCSLDAPPAGDVCTGDEVLENPASCTATGDTITVDVTQLEINGDCGSGYNLDSCNGDSCALGGLAPNEGADGVDNALAGLAPVLVGVGGNLGGVNQAFHDGLCSGDIAISFMIDVNEEEGCATVTVLDDGEAGDAIPMNFSEAGCLSGTVGIIPLNVAGIPGQMNNAVVRATLSEGGLSNGQLGATVDQATAGSIADELIDGGAAVVAQVLDINDDLSGDTSAGCDALSMTLVLGGVSEEAPQ